MQSRPASTEFLVPEQSQRTVLAAAVRGFLTFGVKYGIQPEELCEVAGISQADLGDGYHHVPHAWLSLIRQSIIDRLPQVNVGLQIGLSGSLEQLGYLGHSAKYCATALSYVQLLIASAPAMDSLSQRLPPCLIVGPELVSLSVPAARTDPPQCVEGVFVSVVAILRSLTGVQLSPVEVRFSRTPETLRSEFEELFGCPVSLGCAIDGMVFSQTTMKLPVLSADADAERRYREQFERTVANLGDPFPAAIRRAIEAELRSGQLSLERVAKILGLSARTLQRKLGERGLNYRELMIDVRRSLAARLLADKDCSIFEVAQALGYDASSFNRVFRGWSGMSPSAYRKARAELIREQEDA